MFVAGPNAVPQREQTARISPRFFVQVSVSFCRQLPATADKWLKNGAAGQD
jgi:hypothetical protein